jgi:hypothetical protein
MRFLVLVLLSMGAVNCSSPLSAAVTDYEAGRVTEALRRFRALPPDAVGRTHRARYSLYRGLAHLTVGDAAAAERWLMALKRSVDLDPELLCEGDRARLLAALFAMGHVPGD